MKVGIFVEGQEGMTWENWKRWVTMTEDLGFESIWRSDHLYSLFEHPERPALECWTALTWVASHTSRIKFGPLVSPMTFRPPSMLALQVAAISDLSNGRLVLGIGAGWHAGEHKAFGLPFPSVRERMDRMDNATELFLAAFGSDISSVSGPHYTLDEAAVHPRLAQRPPLMIGGRGEKRVLRSVAKYADEWNIGGVTPARFRAKNEILTRHCDDVGRDPSTILRSSAHLHIVGNTDAELERRLTQLEPFISNFAPPGTARSPEALRELGWFYGRPAEVVEQIKAMEAEGIERVMFQTMELRDEEEFELIAAEVLPHVS